MRIISGSKKSITIRAPKDLPSRPTTDKVKESLFNILINRFKIDEVKVLDLFAGSGSLGIEALSRGAKSCIFIDKSSKAIKTVEENINKLGLPSAYDCINIDVNIKINTELEEETESYASKILTICQEIDILGNYTDVNWFMNLTNNKIITFIRELFD